MKTKIERVISAYVDQAQILRIQMHNDEKWAPHFIFFSIFIDDWISFLWRKRKRKEG